MFRIKLVITLVLAFVLLPGVASAQDTQTFPLPGDAVYPEGVAYDPATGDFFVGSSQGGAVFRGNVGEPGAEAETFLEPNADGRSIALGMKLDANGLLFIAGGETGRMFVYDTGTAELVARFENGADPTFVNDVALTPDGSAFFTDSMNPELYRVFPDGSGGYEFESYLNFEGTPAEYDGDFNLNGIAATPDGRYLITVNSTSGRLFRIDTGTKEVAEIETGDADLTGGDGLLLIGRTLYVVRNQYGQIVPVELSADLLSGSTGEGFTDDSFVYPTTIAAYDGRLLVVNSQFEAIESGTDPELPFTVSGIDIPGQAASASASASASAVPVPDTGGPRPVVLLPLVALLAAAGALAVGYAALRRA